MSQTPTIGLTLTVDRDAGPGDVSRYSTRPFAGTNWTEGRVVRGGWGAIRRSSSDDQGQPKMSTASALLNDDDGEIRAAIAEDEARWMQTGEATLGILSEAGRTAGTPERMLFRARLEEPAIEIQRGRGDARARRVRLNMVDALAPYYDRMIPNVPFTREDFPDINRAIEGTMIPLIGGEHSDAGTTDINGNNAEQGLIPAIHVGMRLTDDDNPLSGAPAFLLPPDDAIAYLNSGSGTRTYYYTITALSADGETYAGTTITVEDAPDTLTSVNSITITWSAIEGATGYVVYGRRNSTPVRRLAVVSASVGSPASPATVEYTDDGSDPEYAPGPPEINTAQVENIDGGFFWDFYVVCLGVVEITAWYASDVATGTTPRRILMPTSTAGVDFLVPGYAGWPHAQPYLEIGGKRITGFYARGPRSFHHTQGIVTMAVNVCGYEDVGDGSGDSIQQAFPLLQHFLNEFVLKNNGEGYLTGNWGPLEEFSDGVSMLQTSKFEAAQNLTEGWLTGASPAEGYRGAIYLREQITVREFLQRFLQTFDAFCAVNHHGQWYPYLIDDAALTDAGRHYRYQIEIKRLEAPRLDKDNIEPRIDFQYDWSPDAQRFRSEIERREDAVAVAAQEGKFQDRGVYQLYWSRDPDTVRDAMERRVTRLRYPRWVQPFSTNYLGVEEEPGDQIRITHPDGVGQQGWTDRAFIVTDHVTEPSRGEVILTCVDVEPLLQVS